MNIKVLLYSIVVGCVVAYIAYAYWLYKTCVKYGYEKAWMSFIPIINRFMLVQIGDVYEDGLMYVPIAKSRVSRNILAIINSIGVLLLFMIGLVWLGYIVYFVTSILIWYDIESDFSETGNIEIVFDAVMCSIGIHSYPAYVLIRYNAFWDAGRLLSMDTGEDEQEIADDYEYDEYPVEDDRYIEEDAGYDVYTEDDTYTEDMREILDEY